MRVWHIVTAVLGVVALVVFVNIVNFTTVSAGERGLVLQFGNPVRVLEPGFHWMKPFVENVVKYDVQTQALSLEGSQAYTKEGQIVVLASTLNYNLDPAIVTALHQEIGAAFETKLIRPIVEEAIKTKVAQYTAIEIPTNRDKISGEIELAIREKLKGGYFIVTDYVLRNEDFSDSYEAAIDAKQKAEQDAKKAENDTKRVAQEQQQEILKAQAVAEKSRLEAEALSHAASADALIKKLQAEALKIFAEKWDGSVPKVVINGEGGGGAGILPFMNINSLLGE